MKSKLFKALVQLIKPHGLGGGCMFLLVDHLFICRFLEAVTRTMWPSDDKLLSLLHNCYANTR